MTRVEYIDSNVRYFATQAVYNLWRGIGQDLDNNFSLPNNVPLVDHLNIDQSNGLFLKYELYSNIYNMLIGAPYDTDGNDSEMYITNEDYTIPGLVDMHLYDVGLYDGEVGDFSMKLAGPPFLKGAVVAAIKSTIELNGGTVRSIDIKEETTSQVWGLPIYANYSVRVFWHGSPLIPGLAALIIYAVVAALFIIGVSVSIWQIMKTQQIAQTTKQVGVVEEVNKALIDMHNALRAEYNDPNTTPARRQEIAVQDQQIVEAITKSQSEVGKAVGLAAKAPDESPFKEITSTIKTVAIAGAVGLGIYAAFQVISSFRKK